MVFKVEDGSVVVGANAYVTVAEVDAYLAERNRSTENSWQSQASSVKQAAIIGASDYIDKRHGPRLKGQRLKPAIVHGRATLTLTGNPSDTETVEVAGTTYTFNTVLGGANSVLIGANADESLSNLARAVNSGESDPTVGAGTVENPNAMLQVAIGDRVVAIARSAGTGGNILTVAETLAAGSWSSSTLLGGSDFAAPQPLEFPRRNLRDRSGCIVHGIPLSLRQAAAEYAIRQVAAQLHQDPEVDDAGRTLLSQKEKVGPIETQVTFQPGGGVDFINRPYPAADLLLAEYLLPKIGTFR